MLEKERISVLRYLNRLKTVSGNPSLEYILRLRSRLEALKWCYKDFLYSFPPF